MNMTVLGVITSIISAAISGFIALMMKNLNDDTRKRKDEEIQKQLLTEEDRALQKQALVAIMRMILKDNADRCLEKGYYSVEEREVYRPVYEIYIKCGGNGIIKELGEKIRNLPYEPNKKEDKR